MSLRPVLELHGAGKSYRAYSQAIWRFAGWVTGRPRGYTDHWVLREVTLSVLPGEAVGIVGRNGAGKSTLLKMVAGTLPPTEGRVEVYGRISAILELGMGFNPEFSGRHNAAHACGLRGHEVREINGIVRWVEEFADIGEYFDQPMRTYSSGMAMRVAFGVATAVRPDLLIVDEALSVGDAAFQRKSFRRIEEFLASGTSLLFVSHGTESVKRICKQAIWLERGGVAMQGTSKEVVDAYEKAVLGGGARTQQAPAVFLDRTLSGKAETQYGTGHAQIVDLEILGPDDRPANVFPETQPFVVKYRVRFLKDCDNIHFGMMLKTVDGICLYATNTLSEHGPRSFRAGDEAAVRFQLGNHLLPGDYFLNCGVADDLGEGHFLHRRIDAAALRVVAKSYDRADGGIANLEAVSKIALTPGERAASAAQMH